MCVLKRLLWLVCEVTGKGSQWMWVYRMVLSLEKGDGSVDWDGGSQDGEK